MLDTFFALAPVFLLIAIGWALKALWLHDEAMWRPAEKLAYFVLIPALVVHDLYNADLASLPFSRMVIALLGAVVIVALALLALRPLLSRILVGGDAGFTSVFQGSIRANFFITLAAAPALLPADGAALVIIAVAFFTVMVNIFAVLVARWGHDGQADIGALIRRLATNPFIVATLVGIAVNLSTVPVPRVVDSTFALLAAAGLPLALLTAGAGLRLATVGVHLPGIFIASLGKLLILPAVAVGLGTLLGLEASVLAMLVLFHSQPTAITSYVLAKQMGGDHELMAGILTTQTLLAVFTVPVMLAVFA